MFNVAIYNIRQHFFNTGQYLSYQDNYKVSKDNENYSILNTNMSQQILKEADGAFKSFFGLLKLKKDKNYNKEVKIPQYLPKDGYFTLVIGQIRIKDNGILDIPMSPSFKRLYGKISIKIPSNLQGKKIKEIRIIPKFEVRFFEIQYSYETEIIQRELNKQNVLAIDFGVTNLATCVTNKGKTFIIDGKKLKAMNQWYNKQNSKLQAFSDKVLKPQNDNKTVVTKKMAKLTINRNNKVRDYLNKTARIIINYCVANDIGTIAVGKNKDIGQNINIGSTNNQNFVNIPTGALIEKISYLSKYNQITFQEQEESYTSKADFFSNDFLPVYDEDSTKTYTFSGRRVTRGQYKSANSKIYNADCNGALNIMRKCSLGGSELTALQSSGNLDMPIRIRVS